MGYVVQLYRNAYKGISPASWWLSLVMLINRAGTMVVPFMTLYLTQKRHYSISHSGAVVACFGLGAISGGFLGGKLTDKFGFYYVQVAALLCGGVMFIVLGQLENFPLLCCFTYVLAVLNESFRPANSTAIAQYSTTENRSRCFSLNRLAINLGWSVGSAIGGFVALHNYELLFWIDGISNIAAALLLTLVLAPSKNAATPAFSKKVEKKTDVGSPYRDKVYLVFIANVTLFSYAFYQLFSTVPVYFKIKLNLTSDVIGSIMSMNGLIIALIEMALVYHLETKRKNMMFMFAGALCMAAAFVSLNVLPGTASKAIFAILVVTAAEMIAIPFMNTFMVSRTNDENRGQYSGLYTIGWSIAQVIGPSTGTLIADHLGFDVLWWVVGVLCVFCGLGIQLLQKMVANEQKFA